MSAGKEQIFGTEIDASVQQCFAAITRFEEYPKWFSSIEQTTVLDRNADGLGVRVEYRIDLRLKSIRYVLEYRYNQPAELAWHAIDGDIESIQGMYRFARISPKRTRATCRQCVSLGFWLPGPIRAIMEHQALKQSVLEFKAAVEAAPKARGGHHRRARQS